MVVSQDALLRDVVLNGQWGDVSTNRRVVAFPERVRAQCWVGDTARGAGERARGTVGPGVQTRALDGASSTSEEPSVARLFTVR